MRPPQVRRQLANEYGAEGSELVEQARAATMLESAKKLEARREKRKLEAKLESE